MKSTSHKLVAFLLMGVMLVTSSIALSQSSKISGRVIDADSRQPMAGATVMLVGTSMGSITDGAGKYTISAIPAGTYTLRALFVGYVAQVRTVAVADGERTEDFELVQTALQQKEVIVEVNRARERETPVAFSTIEKEQIQTHIYGQDAPLLLQGTPGLYAYSTDGVGNGEAKLFVRGFNQNYVQVLINGIPTNDPESNAVYWSNWGSVSSSAASIQVQRGAGSSMYGSGAFGGSFNIITGNPRPNKYYGVALSLGDPMNTMYGIDLNTGLIDNAFALSLKVDRKVGDGNRLGARYEGVNYYLSGSWYINNEQSLKLVLSGAPQKHGYSFSNDISYFKYFNYKANSAPWLPRAVVDQLPANATTGLAHYGLTDGTRELVTDNVVDLSHNHFHKPQLELHYNYDITPVNAIRATAFFSRGRGGGSSINSAGTVPFNLLAADGSIANATVADTLYLKNAYQRDSYSFHQQWGILTNYEMQANENVKLIFGAEFRSWTADHPGYFTNLFGKANLSAQSYGIVDSTGVPTTTTFRRRTYQNDFAQSSDMALWGWDPPNDPTYQSQYRNYRGETPQFTLFTNAIISIEKLTLTGTIQYVGYTYKLTENMPSENAMGRRLTQAEIVQLGLGTSRDEGPDGSGKFYMKEYASASSQTVRNWYVFDLVNATRTRQFWQPKFGVNYNLDENINFMANFSHVQRFVDLGVYYNQGRVNDKAGDEISNQFEVGMGWTSDLLNAKINAYSMTWDNKSSRIQDVSMAGQPGYDRNGYRTILVGKSLNQGIELEFRGKLDMLVEGLEYRGSATVSDNKWKSVLDEVKTDPTTGRRQIFNSSNGFTAAGVRDTVFMDELAGTHVGGPPQTMASLGLTYRFSDFFVGIDANYFADQWGLDGEPFLRIGGEWTNLNDLKNGFAYTYNQKVPSRVLFDAQAGYDFTFEGIQGGASVQVLNIFNKEFVADIDNFGVLPGTLRTLRLNLKLGL